VLLKILIFWGVTALLIVVPISLCALPCRWRYYDALKRRLNRSMQCDIHECFVLEIGICVLLFVNRLRNGEGCPCMSTENSNFPMSENVVGVDACVILCPYCLLVFYGVSSTSILVLTTLGSNPRKPSNQRCYLCCPMYCLYTNVYCTTATGCQLNFI